VVFAVTEGGETSSVIGTIMHAANEYKEEDEDFEEARKRLYFVFNNTAEVIEPFDRSR